ncbi:hypothetical protein D3C76_1026070 [compost metagenome]
MRAVAAVETGDDPLPQAGVIQPLRCLCGVPTATQVEDPDGTGRIAINPDRAAVTTQLLSLHAQFRCDRFPKCYRNRIARDIIVQELTAGGIA